MLVSPVFAQTPIGLTCPSTSVVVGDSFNVSAYVIPDGLALGVQLKLLYDPNEMEMIGVSSPIVGQNPQDVFFLDDRVWIDFNDIGGQGPDVYLTITFIALAENPTATIDIDTGAIGDYLNTYWVDDSYNLIWDVRTTGCTVDLTTRLPSDFMVTKLKVETKDDDKNKLSVKADFTPVVPIDPAIDDVTMILTDSLGNTFEVFVPAGSLMVKSSGNKLIYDTKDKPRIKVEINVKKNTIKVEVKYLSKPNLTPDVLTVEIIAGLNYGVEDVVVDVKKHKMEYSAKK
jgi:hypothetical protein